VFVDVPSMCRLYRQSHREDGTAGVRLVVVGVHVGIRMSTASAVSSVGVFTLPFDALGNG
jgi:hypothetical protein